MTDVAAHSISLASVAAGSAAVVTALDHVVAAQLDDVGIAVGTALVVEHRIPLGGPVVVRVGTARIALGRPVAKGVRVQVAAAVPPEAAAPASQTAGEPETAPAPAGA